MIRSENSIPAIFVYPKRIDAGLRLTPPLCFDQDHHSDHNKMRCSWKSVLLFWTIIMANTLVFGLLVTGPSNDTNPVERRSFKPSKHNAANSIGSSNFNHNQLPNKKKKRRPWKQPPQFLTSNGLEGQSNNVCGIRSPSLLAPRGRQGRIIGGAEVTYGSAPWQVDIRLFRGDRFEHICGGAIISNHLVITAAHCVQVIR